MPLLYCLRPERHVISQLPCHVLVAHVRERHDERLQQLLVSTVASCRSAASDRGERHQWQFTLDRPSASVSWWRSKPRPGTHSASPTDRPSRAARCSLPVNAGPTDRPPDGRPKHPSSPVAGSSRRWSPFQSLLAIRVRDLWVLPGRGETRPPTANGRRMLIDRPRTDCSHHAIWRVKGELETAVQTQNANYIRRRRSDGTKFHIALYICIYIYIYIYINCWMFLYA